MKYVTEPLPAGGADLNAFQKQVGARPIWLAASTHAGEEDAVMTAHIEARTRLTDLLTVIVPRHPDRGDEVAAIAMNRGLAVARRTNADPIEESTDVYLADTLGELGLFYRVAPLVFVGGSLVEEEKLGLARETMASAGEKLLLPADHVIASAFAADAETKTCGVAVKSGCWLQ